MTHLNRRRYKTSKNEGGLFLVKKGGVRAFLIWAIGSLFYLYEYFVRVVPSVMEHDLAQAFHASSAQLATAIGLYLMIYSPMQLLVGPLFDSFGARRLLVPASALLSFSCLLPLIPCENLLFLGLGRCLMGFASAFGFVGVMYLCTLWFPAKQLAMLSGMTTTLGMVGGILGQTYLSPLNERLGWHTTWWLSAIFGLIVTLLLLFCIPRHPDWMPQTKNKHIWLNCYKNLLKVFKSKQTWLAGLLGGSLFMTLGLFADFWAIPYFINVFQFTNTQAVQVTAWLYLGWIVGSPLVGWLSDQLGTRRIPLLISGLSTSLLLLIFFRIQSAEFFTLAFLLFIIGICASGEIVCFTVSVEWNSKQASGTAIAVVNMIVMWMCGFVQTLTGYFLDFLKTQFSLQQAYQISLHLMILSVIVTTLLFVFLGKESPSSQGTHP